MSTFAKLPKLTEAHGQGPRSCILWDAQGNAIVTAGADKRLLIHNSGAEEPLCSSVSHHKAVTALNLAPAGHLLASASLDCTVKLYSYPGAEFQSNVTRFTLPIRALAFSITGGVLAAAGDDDLIKLISTVDSSIVRVLKGHDAPVISLAFDPKNDLLASADSDGTVIYWSLNTGSKVHTLRHAAPGVDVDEAGRNEIAWHPSGDVLAVPGHQFDVVMYDRDTAEERFRLRGGHNTAIGFLAWSPNGKYLATTGNDRKIMLWDAQSKQDLDRVKVGSQICSLSWKPTGNALAVIDVDGKFGVWEDCVPSHLASPSDLKQALAALSHQELLLFDDDDASDKENVAIGEDVGVDLVSSDEDSLDDGENSDSEEALLRPKKEFEKSSKENKAKKTKEVSQVKETSSQKEKQARSKKDHGLETILRPQPCTCKPRPEKQGPFQPGSTQQTSGKRRFLAYNLLGCISSFEAEGVSHVEVEFHDTGRGHRVPSMADYSGFTMAALSEKGSIFANPRRGEKTPSTLVYRPVSGCANNSEWSMRFPQNEEVRAVAVGDRWAAAATSLNYLRIYSETGLQKHVLSLKGPIVTMASHLQLLAIVTNVSDPLESGEQMMEFVIFNICKRQRLLSGPLLLTPGAKLMWLGFSEEGKISSSDSAGVLRIYSSRYGGCWIPFPRSEQQSIDESLWVVGLDATQIFCVKCKAPQVEPPVNPKPILSMVNLTVPLVHSDLGATDLENELLCKSLSLEEIQARLDEAASRGEDDDDSIDQSLKMEAELDRCLLRLIAAACQGDKLARALELATMLSLNKSLEGAIKIVLSMRLQSLAERLNMLLEERRNSEKSAVALQFRVKSDTIHSFLPQKSSSLKVHNAPRKPLQPMQKSSSLQEEVEVHSSSVQQPSEQPQGMTSTSQEKFRAKDDVEIVTLPETKLVQSVTRVKQVSFREEDSVSDKTAPGNEGFSGLAAKPSNPFARSSQNKKEIVPSEGEFSVLNSLKKLQQASTNRDDGKRKTKSDGTSAEKKVKRAKKAAKAS